MAKIRVLMMPVGSPPEAREIQADLAGMRKAIGGGFIECLRITKDIDLWFDDEGRLKQLPFNFMIGRPGEEGVHEIFGPAFLAGIDDEGETVSLTDDQLQHHLIMATRAWRERQDENTNTPPLN